MRIIHALFAIVGLGAVITMPGTGRLVAETLIGITRVGEWRVACVGQDEGCSAFLELERGVSPKAMIRGRYGNVQVRAGFDERGGTYVRVAYDDHVVPTWGGTPITQVRVDDGAVHSLSCLNRQCAVTNPDGFIDALQRGTTLVIEPRGRDAVEVDVRDFRRVWRVLEHKAAAAGLASPRQG